MKTYLTLLILFFGLFAQAQAEPWRSQSILDSRDCILKIVAKRMGLRLSSVTPLPKILVQGTVDFSYYQSTLEKHWGWKPEQFVNAYVFGSNELFIHLDGELYKKRGSTPYDVMAHELTHYMQYQYQGLPMDDFTEGEAVKLQNWFREQFQDQIVDGNFVCPR